MSKTDIIKKLTTTKTVLKDGRLTDAGMTNGKHVAFSGMGARVHV